MRGFIIAILFIVFCCFAPVLYLSSTLFSSLLFGDILVVICFYFFFLFFVFINFNCIQNFILLLSYPYILCSYHQSASFYIMYSLKTGSSVS